MAADGPATLELVVERLAVLKEAQERDRKHVDDRLDQMQSEMRASFAGLTYVSMQTYERDRASDARIDVTERKAIDDYASETRRIAEGARSLSWSVAAFVILSIGAILALIKAVAG